jgi:hypothetical protein
MVQASLSRNWAAKDGFGPEVIDTHERKSDFKEW